MKVLLIVVSALCVSLSSIPAHAISAGYRAQLERSGCTQVTELNHTCDIHKTKAENHRLAREKQHAQAARKGSRIIGGYGKHHKGGHAIGGFRK